jgi:transposase
MPATSRSAVPEKRASQVKRVRARRDFKTLAARLLQAAGMFEHGRRQVDVVAELGVSAQTASRWHRAWAARGRAGLAGAGRAGRVVDITPGIEHRHVVCGMTSEYRRAA